jgi:hypothetical protein
LFQPYKKGENFLNEKKKLGSDEAEYYSTNTKGVLNILTDGNKQRKTSA